MTIPTLDPDPVPYVLSVERADGRGTARIEGFLVPICLLNKQKKGPMWVIAAVPPSVLRDDLSWVADEIADENLTNAAWHRVANAVGDWGWFGTGLGVPLSGAARSYVKCVVSSGKGLIHQWGTQAFFLLMKFNALYILRMREDRRGTTWDLAWHGSFWAFVGDLKP